jgi:hypothetical protein
MLAITYPGNLLLFYKIMIIFAELDVLQGPALYEKFLVFH